MKKRKLERELVKLGWHFKRHGGNHDIWTNGDITEQIPRHHEIDEVLAKQEYKKELLCLKVSFTREKVSG